MIEVLTSGVALGVHVPGLLLADRLRERGARAGVTVLERLLPAAKLATTAAMRTAFHRDFRVALVGQRVATNPFGAVPGDRLDELFAEWDERGVRRFVVLSGYWLPVLERYAGDADVVVCHVDSVASPSFKGDTGFGARVWLADAERVALPATIPVSREPQVPWADRAKSLLLHGGGWGMGTYRERVGELLGAGFELDVVAHEEADAEVVDPAVRYHLIDPAWHPWVDDGYPPFGRLRPGTPTTYARGVGHHASFDLMRTSAAAVSKPGGGTLLDSLWSATPLVLLEPFGAHEQRNSELWQRLGFGITVEAWRERGYALEVLAELHEALSGVARRVPDLSGMLLSGGA
ncbi:hypothetical protein [Saccharothrix syringae]|uniref:UDP-glucuronosyltransferase n=1 Tax=Saccharothrix syringae TaxID=103733 RepID=A0A5Q0GWM7_SACSY|nr:hypothetical protein [Saccharothrix syringae]QFZ17870.1 hypothetical protein EKG83_10590 [Saccharothrix syringae]